MGISNMTSRRLCSNETSTIYDIFLNFSIISPEIRKIDKWGVGGGGGGGWGGVKNKLQEICKNHVPPESIAI